MDIDALECLTRRSLYSHPEYMGSVTFAFVACGQPCLLRRDAHAVAVRGRDVTVGFVVMEQADWALIHNCHGV